MSDCLHHLLSSHDQPDVVQVKVKAVSDELAASSHDDRNALQEATDYLHE